MATGGGICTGHRGGYGVQLVAGLLTSEKDCVKAVAAIGGLTQSKRYRLALAATITAHSLSSATQHD